MDINLMNIGNSQNQLWMSHLHQERTKMENLKSPTLTEDKKKVARDFESLFLTMMLKEMRKTQSNESIYGKSFSTKIFKEMFDEYLAQEVVKNKSVIGVAKILYEELQ